MSSLKVNRPSQSQFRPARGDPAVIVEASMTVGCSTVSATCRENVAAQSVV